MGFGLLNLAMLFGLAGMSIPIIIHLLNRRRFEVVDWGAMQFLRVSETTRRRLMLEELLLMAVRMGLIAVLVLALASPFADSAALAALGVRPNRDAVLVFDGSTSMGFTGTGTSAHEAAKEWAAAYLDGLAAGDSVAVLQAREQPAAVLGEPSHDLERVRDHVARVPAPAGGCDWPQALAAAFAALAKSRRPEREVILLTDGQRFGWADEGSLLRWELLATQLRDKTGPLTGAAPPRVRVVNVDPNRPADPPNWSLAPLRVSRAVAAADQEVTFRTALELRGQKEYRPPHRLRLEVDGKAVTDLKPPASAPLTRGQVPMSFTHRFASPGSHLVSVVVEPDPPPEQRPPGYVVRDHLPGDNRQDYAVEVVPALPVLLVDGGARPGPTRKHGADFLRDALAPAGDRTPVVLAKVVAAQEFSPGLLTTDLGQAPNTRPRVLVLGDVPRLTVSQHDAVAQFLADGGGVLVTLGERVEAGPYNESLYRGGQGWLPARLEAQAGDEAKPERAAQPLASSFFHPALDLFREVPLGGLGDARFPRWWKVTTPGRDAASVPVGLLNTGDPFLVEKPFRAGRVLLCCVPLDPSWGTNLVRLPEFVPLAHELVYYLAGARSAEHNLQPGQPLRYRLADGRVPPGLTLRPPTGEARPLVVGEKSTADAFVARLVPQARGATLVYEGARAAGVYRVGEGGHAVYYVVQPGPREADLTPCDDADRDKVAGFVPVRYESAGSDEAAPAEVTSRRQELWGWFLGGVIALLCGEVWMTRRLAVRAVV